MNAVLWIGAAVLVIVLFFVVANRGVAKMLRKRREAVAALAQTLGLPAPSPERPTELEGTTSSGVAFRLGVARMQGARGPRDVLTLSGRPRQLLPRVIVRNRLRDDLEVHPGLVEMKLGDAMFDDAFRIQASDTHQAKALLTKELQAELLADPHSAILRAELCKIDEAEVAISYQAVAPGLFDAARLERIARRVLALCG